MNENEWIKKVKAYRLKHPELSYKECLVKLANKKQKGGQMRTWQMKPRQELKFLGSSQGSLPEDYVRSRIFNPLPKLNNQRGGNPALLALAQNSGQISDALESIIGNITEAVDKQQERGFEKNKLTGWYDMRKRFKNERVIESKTIELFNRHKALRDKGKFPKWSDDKIWEFASQNS